MTRGVDQLSDWAVLQPGDRGQPRLHLRCTNDVATQVERRLGSVLGPRLPTRAQDQGEWTHRYPLSRSLADDESAFLELLNRVLTLRIGPPVTVAIALDYYKDPSSHEDPQQWTNTPTGELVHRGKYAGSDDAGKQLAAELAQFMERHPDLQNADVIVSVPSHSERRFSERLAKVVARLRGVSVVEIRDDVTNPVKDTDPEGRTAARYSVETGAVEDKAVVVIDDVARTGESLRSVAAYLKEQGARGVSVLVGVRTMRN